MKRIKIFIIDDHTLFREGLKALLTRQEGIDVIGEAGGGIEGVNKVLDLKPDVVLMDIKMPDMTGLDALRLIMESRPETKVIILTVSEDDEDLFAAVRAGAKGYLLKNVEADKLISSIHQVARGEAALSGRLAERIFAEFREMATGVKVEKPPKDILSNREKEILLHLTNGKSNKEIANILDIAESTVKIHVQNIMRKLNVTSRVQAAVYALEHGLVSKGSFQDKK